MSVAEGNYNCVYIYNTITCPCMQPDVYWDRVHRVQSYIELHAFYLVEYIHTTYIQIYISIMVLQTDIITPSKCVYCIHILNQPYIRVAIRVRPLYIIMHNKIII